MKTRMLVAGMLAVGLIATACSKSLSLDEYFAEIDSLRQEMNQTSSELEQKFQDDILAATTDEEGLAVIKNFLQAMVDETSGAVDDLDGIGAPSEVEATHGELVAASRASLDAVQAALDDWEQFQTTEDLTKLFTEDLANVDQRSTEACNELQSIADDNSIEADGQPVNLECGE